MYKKNTKYKKEQCFGGWRLDRILGSGGNGEVWLSSNNKGEQAAIKLIKRNKLTSKRYSRFCDEINAVKNNSHVKGILPILDCNLSSDDKSETPWYVMPCAVPLEKHLQDKPVYEVIKSIINIAKTLCELHERGISHRDIKPENLFYYQDVPCLGDFGLVKYKGKRDLTSVGEKVGPRWTIAPEMERDANKADGPRADTYSLAKTLWILLTRQEKGFEGQYNDTSDNISIERYHTTIYARPLHDFFYECTDNDPLKRPNMKDFAGRLESWIEQDQEFHKRNPSQWKDLQRELFPISLPSRTIWERTDEIITVLKRIAAPKTLGHIFLPTGGGSHLDDVIESWEEGCIELWSSGMAWILKPKRLIFESFGDNSNWNYFRLETYRLEAADQHESNNLIKCEHLTEIKKGLYTDHEAYEFDDFNGERLPETARSVTRILEGDFVIFSVISPYNLNSSTYDARHNNMNADQFRQYISQIVSSSVISSQSKNGPKMKFIRFENKRRSEKKLTESDIDLLNSVISLAEERTKEKEMLRKKHGLDINVMDFWDENAQQYLSEHRPKDNDLIEFLKKMDPDDLILIGAVMYAGRDSRVYGRAYPLEDMIRYHSKEYQSLVYSIAEKSPLADYIRAGIKAYTEDGD